ncbi:MAG: alanine--tRNA ligase [Candidatus Paceibacterota bacterium]
MTAEELRKKFLIFFEEKGHKIIPSAFLIPENDPSTLFISAGMQPLVPYLMGEKHPEGKRLVDIQKCLRTGDIEEVGDATHHTFFEMLGNWSLGDYFKEEAILWSFEFLTKELGLEKEKLAVSVFEGDENSSFDEEAFQIWKSLGISEKRITRLGKEDNWWPAGGKEKGPQGPDTEIFYWTGKEDAPDDFNPEEKRRVEIWNNVFMQYNKKEDGSFEVLKQKNVDTGMGLERTLAVINGFDDNYRTELFSPMIEKIEKISGKKYEDNKKEFRIIADHIKAAVMILGDKKGIEPSNKDQGYVLRRLIRRAARYGKMIGIEKDFAVDLIQPVLDIYGEVYPEVIENRDFIKEQLKKEEEKFLKTLEKGLKELNKKVKAGGKISGKEAFDLYQTFGFPKEMIKEEVDFDEKEFEKESDRHSELSKTASAGMFKGGLSDVSEETTRLHTAAHLMLEALRRVLGDHVEQKGSNITAERLRFDFSHPEKVTGEQLEEVEKIVNEQIKKKLPVKFLEMTKEEAKESGATGVFEHKYGERVKVYFIGEEEENFSKEICGGPHVKNTEELGEFKIIKEESSGAGVRRIKAVLK